MLQVVIMIRLCSNSPVISAEESVTIVYTTRWAATVNSASSFITNTLTENSLILKFVKVSSFTLLFRISYVLNIRKEKWFVAFAKIQLLLPDQ